MHAYTFVYYLIFYLWNNSYIYVEIIFHVLKKYFFLFGLCVVKTKENKTEYNKPSVW